MSGFAWSLRCGDRHVSGHGAGIAHAIAGLRGALEDLVAAAESPEVDGMISGPGVGPVPFWMGWGPLGPTGRGEAIRDVPRARSCIDELAEGLRDELHRVLDNLAVATDGADG